MAALVATALVAAACGTRVDPEVYERVLAQEAVAQGSSAPRAPEELANSPDDEPVAQMRGDREPETREGSEGGEPVPAAGETAADGLAQRAPTDGQGDGQANDPPAGAAGLPALSDEVVGDVITVGMHVPETGAAPMPMDWKHVLDLVEDYVNRELPVHGRTLRLVVEDDGYDPSVGRAACRRLLSAEPLLVIGHTMPAAQDACASLFDDRGIPYLMRGTTPAVLEGRPLAFFGTAPDDLQGRLLAQYILREHDAASRPVGVLHHDDQLAARDAFVAEIEAAGGTVPVVEQGAPRQADFGATIQNFRRAGVELVFLSTPPVDAIRISVQARGEGYDPTWLGGGTYWNYNMTLEAAGSAMDGAISLSPWPTIDSPAADEFKRVYRSYHPDREPEDLGLIIWGWMQLLRELLDQAGPDLSRQTVLETLQTFEFRRPYWNPVDYGVHGRTGTAEVAVFRADAQARRWRQLTGFVGGF